MKSIIKRASIFNIAVILALVLSIPSINIGLMVDDFLHKAILNGTSPISKPDDLSLFGLFSFLAGSPNRITKIIDLGLLPWWTDYDAKITFFRPLTEFTLWLDYKLWPNFPQLMHVQSIVWYLSILFMYKKWLTEEETPQWSSLAVLLFAISGAHSIPVAWIACRSILIATFFGLISLQYHQRWIREKNKSNLVKSIIFLMFSLLGGEYGLSTLAFIISYAVWMVDGGVRQKIKSILPATIFTTIWVFLYSLSGFGAKNSDLYIDPINDLSNFIQNALIRVPEMLTGHFTGITLYSIPSGKTGHLVAYLIGIVFFLPTLPVIKKSKKARYYLTAAILSLIPVCAIVAQDRLLFFSGIGISAIIAESLVYWLGVQKSRKNSFTKPVIGYIAILLLTISHFIISPALFIPMYMIQSKSLDGMIVQPAIEIQKTEDIQNKNVIVINPIHSTSYYYSAVMLSNGNAIPKSLIALASGGEPVDFKRVSESQLLVSVRNGFLQNLDDWYSRSKRKKFVTEEEIKLDSVSIIIKELNNAGIPISVLFTFEKSLDDPSYIFFKWNALNHSDLEGKLTPWPLPKVGTITQISKYD